MADDALLKALGQLAREGAKAPVAPELAAPLDASFKQRTVEKLLRRLPVQEPWWKRWRLPVLVPVAMAASLVAVLSTLGGTPALPAYAFEARGAQELRGEAGPAAATLVLKEGAELRLVFRPEAPVEGDVTVAAFMVGPSSVRVPGEVERSGAGALRLRVAASDVAALPRGVYELVAVVSRAGEGPGGVEAAAGEPKQGWQVFRQPVRLE